jgi:hypothetical protein
MAVCVDNQPGNSVTVNTVYNTVNVIPDENSTIVEVITPGPQGPPGDPSLFTSSFVQILEFNAFTASYYADSASFSSSISELQDFSASYDPSKIFTGSIEAKVNVGSDVFLIKSGSRDFFNIKNTSETTAYSNLFIIRNFTTQLPVLTVSQSIVKIATQSFDPTGSTDAGSIWFTSSSFYVGLE